MQERETIRIPTGDRTLAVARGELPALGAALRSALADPRRIGESGAPVALVRDLPRSFDEVSYSEETGEVRAGNWILAGDAEGLFWQNRIAPPAPPRIGLMLMARLVRTESGWTVPRLVFKRLR